MRYQVIQHNECCPKLKQRKNDAFVNVEVRYIFELLHENKLTIPLNVQLKIFCRYGKSFVF